MNGIGMHKAIMHHVDHLRTKRSNFTTSDNKTTGPTPTPTPGPPTTPTIITNAAASTNHQRNNLNKAPFSHHYQQQDQRDNASTKSKTHGQMMRIVSDLVEPSTPIPHCRTARLRLRLHYHTAHPRQLPYGHTTITNTPLSATLHARTHTHRTNYQHNASATSTVPSKTPTATPAHTKTTTYWKS